MAFTYKKLASGIALTTIGVGYTCGGTTTGFLRGVLLVNYGTADQPVTVHYVASGGSASSSNMIIYGDTEGNKLAANYSVFFPFDVPGIVLTSGEMIQIGTSDSGSVSYIFYGGEKPV